MKKKWIGVGLFAAAALVIGAFTVRAYGVSGDITRSEILSPNTLQNRRSITEKVLAATGRQDQFAPEEAQNVTVYWGDAMGDERQEAVIAIEFTPKNTIVAVYTPNETGYQFAGDLGEFFYIRTVQFMPIESEGKDVIILREYADQHIGAYERSSFLKGYFWDGDSFHQVLSVPEGIQASWNSLWDTKGVNDPGEWRRVDQRTDITWEGGAYPVLDLVHNQRYSTSTDMSTMNIPDDSTFTVQDNRIATEKYYWSGDWHRFILSEKVDKTTGERVAVIEEFSTSPYAMLPEFSAYLERVRIERKDGTMAVVDSSSLRDISDNDNSARFYHTT